MFRCKKKALKVETPAITDSIVLDTDSSMMLKYNENETVNLLYMNVPYK